MRNTLIDFFALPGPLVVWFGGEGAGCLMFDTPHEAFDYLFSNEGTGWCNDSPPALLIGELNDPDNWSFDDDDRPFLWSIDVGEMSSAHVIVGCRRPSEAKTAEASEADAAGHRLLDLIADALFRAVDERPFEYTTFLQSLGFGVILMFAEDVGELDSDGVWHPPTPPEGYVLAWQWSNDDSDGCFFITPETDFARLLLSICGYSNERAKR